MIRKILLLLLPVFVFSIVFVKLNIAVNTEFYHGNTKTMTYHHKDCRFYDCQSCTINFLSQDEAEKAGYKACQICMVPEKQKPDIPPPAPSAKPLTVSKALWNITKNLFFFFIVEVALFGFYNCFIRGDIGLLERWNRFQGWLFGKDTTCQLKEKIEQSISEENKLNQSVKVKKFLFEIWFSIRDFFIWLHRFTGCFINFIILTCFTITSWNDSQFLFYEFLNWLRNIGE